MTLIDLRTPNKSPQHHINLFFSNLEKQGYKAIILSKDEIELIIKALEDEHKDYPITTDLELCNDLKMVLKGTL